jgi:hypothetical protein
MEDPQRHIVRRQGWKSDAEGPLQSRHGNGAWSRCGVLYVYDDKMMGGNLAFAFIGNYRESAGEVLADLSTLRHNDDPAHQPLLKTDVVTLTLRGRQHGEQYHFEGGTTALPGVEFRMVMTPISEETAPPVISARQELRTVYIQSISGCSMGSTAGTPALCCCMMVRYAAAMPILTIKAPTPALTANGGAR